MRRMQVYFAVAVVLMFLHKVECWFTAEWQGSPLFRDLIALAQARGSSPADAMGEAMFLVFVFWLFVGLAMVVLALGGGAGPMLVLGGWGMTFLLEWHHLVRTAMAGAYYSGVVTAAVYVAFGVVYWHALGGLIWDHVRGRRRAWVGPGLRKATADGARHIEWQGATSGDRHHDRAGGAAQR